MMIITVIMVMMIVITIATPCNNLLCWLRPGWLNREFGNQVYLYSRPSLCMLASRLLKQKQATITWKTISNTNKYKQLASRLL